MIITGTHIVQRESRAGAVFRKTSRLVCQLTSPDLVYLSRSVIKHVKPSQDSLLVKCLHGKTQNQNESFNSLIWERLPKTTYVSMMQLRFGTYDAVSHFNIGRKSSILVYELLGMIPGSYMTEQCHSLNRKRLSFSFRKSSEGARKRRKVLRGKEKSQKDKNEETEGTVYESGAF